MSNDTSLAPQKLTVLTVARDTNPKHLLEFLYSLIHQKYPGWECILIDNASASGKVSEIAGNYAVRDCRIKLLKLDRVLTEPQCLDLGLKKATGDFVTVAEDTAILPKDAFYEVASLLMAKPYVDVVAGDSDVMDDDGYIYIPCKRVDCTSAWLIQNIAQFPPVYVRKGILWGKGIAHLGAGSPSIAAQNGAQIPHVLYHSRDHNSKLRRIRLSKNSN